MTNTTTEHYDVKNRWSGKVQFTAEIEVTPDMTPSIKLGLAVRWGVRNGANLRGANLSDANLRYADLRDADLRDANLSGAYLRDVDLRGAYLRGADLRDACLRGVDLRGAYLRGVDLRGVDLGGVDLRGVDLGGVDLRGADLRDACLLGVDLRGAYLRGAYLRAFKSCLWMTLTQNKAEVPALLTALKDGRVDGSKYEGECACLVGTIANAKNVDHTELHCNSSDPSEQWFLMISKGDKPTDDSAGGFASSKVVEWIEEWQSFNHEVSA